jgi:hypothetical protein
MQMPKEYVLVLIAGLFLLAYLLEAVVDPLSIPISTPYEYLTGTYVTKYPFSTAIIGIRALAVLITPLWLMSFISGGFSGKAVTLLVTSALVQLYAVQALVGGNIGITIEWSISLALGGATLLLPMLFFFAKGAVSPAKKSQSPKEIGSLTEDDDDF